MILVYTVKSGKSTDSDRSNENIQYSDHKKKKEPNVTKRHSIFDKKIAQNLNTARRIQITPGVNSF